MFKNKLFLLLAISIIILIGAVSYVLIGKEKSTREEVQESTQTQTVTESNKNSDEVAIKELLDTKYNNDPDTTSLTISINKGDYAKGGYGMSDPQGGGGLWFAAKVDGNWKIVYDGNGIVTCDTLESYPDYPTDLIPSCWDEENGVMVQR